MERRWGDEEQRQGNPDVPVITGTIQVGARTFSQSSLDVTWKSPLNYSNPIPISGGKLSKVYLLDQHSLIELSTMMEYSLGCPIQEPLATCD